MYRPVATLAIVAAVSVAAAGTAHAATDADQVRGVLDVLNNAYNSSDFDAFASHLCAQMRETDDFKAGWYVRRRVDGPTRITVNSVNVAGDDAFANVRFEAANRTDAKTMDVEFIREGLDWKACRYHAGRSV
jgi:hypothetical protein